MSLFRNPVSYCIYFFVGVLALASFWEAPLIVLQHLFLPYTVDVSRGVGDVGASIFRAVTFVMQLLVILFVVLVAYANKTGHRIVLSIFGILFVVLYFLIVVFGYVVPGLH